MKHSSTGPQISFYDADALKKSLPMLFRLDVNALAPLTKNE